MVTCQDPLLLKFVLLGLSIIVAQNVEPESTTHVCPWALLWRGEGLMLMNLIKCLLYLVASQILSQTLMAADVATGIFPCQNHHYPSLPTP